MATSVTFYWNIPKPAYAPYGDMNNIMNAKEKLGPRPADARQCCLFDLATMALPTLG